MCKFGGASLADGTAIRRACALLREAGGERPIAVVSAIAGATVQLDRLAHDAAGGAFDFGTLRLRHRSLLAQLGLDSELLDRHLAALGTVLQSVRARRRLRPAERDHVLSFGERMSARIVAAALRDGGAEATPIDAFDLGLLSDSNHGSAKPLLESREVVRHALAHVPGIPVVTGFVAADARGSLTTLGRNGSDLSATLIAEAVGAREVQFWKPVGGMLTADPRLVPEARTIRRLGYDAAAAFSRHGASVLHPDAIEPLRRAGIPGRVLGIDRADVEGSLLCADASAGGPVGVAAMPEPDGRVRVSAIGDELDAAALGAHLERAGVLSEPAGVEPLAASFRVAALDAERAARALHAALFSSPAPEALPLAQPSRRA